MSIICDRVKILTKERKFNDNGGQKGGLAHFLENSVKENVSTKLLVNCSQIFIFK